MKAPWRQGRPYGAQLIIKQNNTKKPEEALPFQVTPSTEGKKKKNLSNPKNWKKYLHIILSVKGLIPRIYIIKNVYITATKNQTTNLKSGQEIWTEFIQRRHTWVNLKDIMLTEVNHKQKEQILHDSTYMKYTEKSNSQRM